jgi:hypothetical protein
MAVILHRDASYSFPVLTPFESSFGGLVGDESNILEMTLARDDASAPMVISKNHCLLM